MGLHLGSRISRRYVFSFCLTCVLVIFLRPFFPPIARSIPSSVLHRRPKYRLPDHVEPELWRYSRWVSPNLLNELLRRERGSVDPTTLLAGNSRYKKPGAEFHATGLESDSGKDPVRGTSLEDDALYGQTILLDTPRHHEALSASGPTQFTARAPADPLPQTEIIRHAPGWTVLENLYMSGGTFFVVTSKAWSFPAIRMITSTGLVALNTPENIAAREPTDREMKFLKPQEAFEKWGNRVWPIQDLTFFLNDPPQFLNHYYHFVAETLMGLWRMYTSFDSKITVTGETILKNPARIIFARLEPNQWKDGAGLNQFFLHAAFPSISVETVSDWEGRIRITQDGQKVYRFDKILISDRSAAFRGEWCGGRNQRIVSEAFEATREGSSRWWWEPLRRAVLRLAGLEEEVMRLNERWETWRGTGNGERPPNDDDKALGREASWKIPVVITYISRQGGGGARKLRADDHDLLVKSLEEMGSRKGWEVNIPKMETMSAAEQLKLAARTTVMLGVHGNGLTHLLMMPLTPISTVIEIFIPGGLAKDYEWTSRALNMRHYAIWNDTYATHPNEPKVDYPEGFQGREIPVHGPSIVQLIEDRVEGRLP